MKSCRPLTLWGDSLSLHVCVWVCVSRWEELIKDSLTLLLCVCVCVETGSNCLRGRSTARGQTEDSFRSVSPPLFLTHRNLFIHPSLCLLSTHHLSPSPSPQLFVSLEDAVYLVWGGGACLVLPLLSLWVWFIDQSVEMLYRHNPSCCSNISHWFIGCSSVPLSLTASTKKLKHIPEHFCWFEMTWPTCSKENTAAFFYTISHSIFHASICSHLATMKSVTSSKFVTAGKSSFNPSERRGCWH